MNKPKKQHSKIISFNTSKGMQNMKWLHV